MNVNVCVFLHTCISVTFITCILGFTDLNEIRDCKGRLMTVPWGEIFLRRKADALCQCEVITRYSLHPRYITINIKAIPPDLCLAAYWRRPVQPKCFKSENKFSYVVSKNDNFRAGFLDIRIRYINPTWMILRFVGKFERNRRA